MRPWVVRKHLIANPASRKLAPRMFNHPYEVVADDEASIYGV
ncbi:MAG: hypothetical protein ABI977_34400 [Acidobacteriota bacterium]